MNVTDVPAHMVVAVAATLTDGTNIGFTVKFEALFAVLLLVVTDTTPVAVPGAGVAVILVALTTVYDVAGTPPNVTAVAPVKLVPVIVTRGRLPLHPDAGAKPVIVVAADTALINAVPIVIAHTKSKVWKMEVCDVFMF